MGSDCVVVQHPGLYDGLGFRDTAEPVFIQALVSELSVEALSLASVLVMLLYPPC